MREDRTLHVLQVPRVFTQVSIESSASNVYHQLILYVLDSPEFNSDISHWTDTSSQVPVCSVEPGIPDDVGLIVNLAVPLSIITVLLTFYTSTATEDSNRSRAVCCERWWACYQPWLFVNFRGTHLDDPVQ